MTSCSHITANLKVEIGKFQNTIAEVNEEYLKENNILVVRQTLVAGAVCGFWCRECVLLNPRQWNLRDFKRTYEPAIKALHELGATAVEQTGRNDLTIEGKKVSDAAMTISNGRVYGGFSLLLDVDYDAMEKS